MKAVVQKRYGSPSTLSVAEIAVPRIRNDQVLVRVHAASVHADVWHAVSGFPLWGRLLGGGIVRPKYPVPGTDLAGEIVEVGRGVTAWQVGDRVFGEIADANLWRNHGSFAEFAAIDAASIALIPDGMSFVDAAALPTSALIAMDNLRGVLHDGDAVLVNGAGGGVGVFAVQLAVASGGVVTAVDSAGKARMLQSIGASHVIDYANEDFTADGSRYDVIVDIPGNRSFADLKRVLKAGGRYVLIGHDNYGRTGRTVMGSGITRFLRLMIFAPFGRSQGAEKRPDARTRITELAALASEGAITPVVDRTFPLDQVQVAMRYLMTESPAGKVVLTI